MDAGRSTMGSPSGAAVIRQLAKFDVTSEETNAYD
jgi:hypothetical protein